MSHLTAPAYSPSRVGQIESPSRAPPTLQSTGLNTSAAVPAGHQGALVPTQQQAFDQRASTVHHHLLVAEREITDLKEEVSLKTAELEALRTALQREHETNLRQHSKHSQDMEHMRNEYERQNSQLVEQLTILKGVSETASAEKQRLVEESAQKKQQLMQLLERERDEKSQIMADYRTQTESLIAEQGREITGLRNLLEAAREEEEKLISASKKQDERRMEAEDLVIKLEAQLADEKVAGQRRLREQDQRNQSQLESLRHQNELDSNDLRAQLLKAKTQLETSEDAVRSLNEKIKANEAAADAERARLRAAYDTDIDTLQEELKSVKSVKEITEQSLRSEMDRAERTHEEMVHNLKRDVDVVRHERQAAAEESRVQKEILLAEHARRNAELQQIADNSRKELAEERNLRKNAESAKHSTSLENDSLKQNVSRLSLELENFQLDTRTKERNTEQQHLEAVEALRNSVRSLESDYNKIKQQHAKLEVEAQKSEDDNKAKIVQLEGETMDLRRKSEALRISLDDANAQKEEAVNHATQQVDTLSSRKVHLEAEVSRLERALTESEARGVAATKQLSNERRALEQSTTENQNLKVQHGDLKAQLDTEKTRTVQISETVGVKEDEILQLKEINSEQLIEIKDLQRQSDRLRDDANELEHNHEATVNSMKASHRREISGFEEEVSQANTARRQHQQAHAQAEESLKALRDDVTKWERECINKDEVHADNIRNLNREHEEELLRMDTVVNTLRDDLSRCQTAKAAAQREAGDAGRDVERRVAIVQEALEAERNSKQRLHDELRAKEQLAAEVQGTVRLLTTRLASKEDDIRRLDAELQDTTGKVHDAHSALGKKDATIGQLTAKLRVYESRGSL